MTGVYQHQAGVGMMVVDLNLPGYRGEIGTHVQTIPEVLRTSGYSTYMLGKWHLTEHKKKDSPNYNWPIQRGFDKFYGTIMGAGSFYDPISLCRNNTFITPENDEHYKPETYYYTDAISDNAVMFLKDHQKESSDKPFFMYVAYTAAHWPLHALPEDIKKYEGKYDKGFKPVREARMKKMKELGIIDEKWGMSPQAEDWEKDVTDKKWEARTMEVYAAMIDRMDQGIGTITEELKRQGIFDNTLIVYLQDNGACAEASGRKTPKKPYRTDYKPMAPDELQTEMWPYFQTRDGRPVRHGPGVMAGPADTWMSYDDGWANVCNTPFRMYKHYSHEGGISTPFVVSWPNGIEKKLNGGFVDAPSHLIDIMATCVDLSGANYPEKVGEQKIVPMEGISLYPAFQGKKLKRDDGLYFEHHLNSAVRYGDWKLVRTGDRKKGVFDNWELFNMKEDRTELNDLSGKYPEKVKELEERWNAWAERALVYPSPFIKNE
jgi:arylsulfatase